VIAFYLIALIKEPYNFLLKEQSATEETETNNQISQTIREYNKNKLTLGKRYPEDFLDLSGGNMGI
jgi:hypothetical protein